MSGFIGGGGGSVPAGQSPLVMYYVDEAASGQVPTIVEDKTTPALDLTITYDGANPAYTSNAAGKGLAWDTADTASSVASADIMGTKVDTGLQNSTNMTIETSIDYQGYSVFWGGNIFGIFQGPSILDAFSIYVNNDGMLHVVFQGDLFEYSERSIGLHVLHAVYDSTQASGSDRIKLYDNGSLQVPVAETVTPAQDELITFSSGQVCLGTEDVSSEFVGTVYYGALYDYSFTSGQASSASTLLIANNDRASIAAAASDRIVCSGMTGSGGAGPTNMTG